MAETTKYDQKFYQAEADALFPAGCKCGNNGCGDCDWCGVYYYGPELTPFQQDLKDFREERRITRK